MKRYSIICLLLSQASYAFDLKETLELAKRHDPGYRSQVLGLEAKKLTGRIATASLLPSIDVGFYGTSVTNSTDTNNFRLTVSGDLYNASTLSAVKKGNLETKESFVKLQALDITHSIETIEHYFNALKAYSNRKVKHFAFHQYEQSYKEASEKEKAGLLSPSETLAYLSNLDLAKLALTMAQNDLDHALRTLEGQTNTPVNALHIFNKTDIPEFEVPSLETLIDHALTSGYDIQLAHLALKKASTDLTSAGNKFAPKASIHYERAQPSQTVFEHFGDSSYSTQKLYLSLSLNAFSGFKDINTLKQQRISYRASAASLDESQYSIKLSIEKAYRDHENNQLQAHAAKIALKSANAALQSVKERHSAGNASELEFATAVAQATLAQESFYSAVYTLMSGYLKLKAKASMLSESDIQMINDHLDTEIEFH